MKLRRNLYSIPVDKDKKRNAEPSPESAKMHLKRRIRCFILPFLLLFGLFVVSYMHIFNDSEDETVKLKPINSFDQDWFKNKLNFSRIRKASFVDDCNETVNVYIQFVLEDQRNLNLTNSLNNLILSILRKTNCHIEFYVLSNALGRDVVRYMMSVFNNHYDWFPTPVIHFIDYYNTSRDAVQYTKPMKVKLIRHCLPSRILELFQL